MRIIVLGGCGTVGEEVTRDLARTSDFDEIVIADSNLEKAQALTAELGDGRLRSQRIDVSDENCLADQLRGFDVVANCTTYHFGLVVSRAAIQAGVNYLDLGGLFNTPRQLELDQAARQAGVTLCLGCGATPGVTNLMARRAADQMDHVDQVHIAFVSLRSIAPSPGLLDTVLDEFSPESQRFYWQEGQFVEVPAFAGAKRVLFSEPAGESEVYYVPHSETHTLPRFLGKGVRHVDVRGTWRPEIMRALRVFADYGLTGLQVVTVGGREISSKEFVRSHILQHAATVGGDGEWAFLLNVQVSGQLAGCSIRCEYRSSHPARSEWGTSATARVTGIPASIGAQKLARGEVARTGVLGPEACFEPLPFFAELAKRGIGVHETVEEDRTLGVGFPVDSSK